MKKKHKILQLNQKINNLLFSFLMFQMEFDTYDCSNPDIFMKTESVNENIDRLQKDCNTLKEISDNKDFKDRALKLQTDIELETEKLNSVEKEFMDYAASLNVDEYAEIQSENK